VAFSDGQTVRKTWTGQERWMRWRFRADAPAEQVIIDPRGVWALEVERRDNYWRTRSLTALRPHPLWALGESLRLLRFCGLPWM